MCGLMCGKSVLREEKKRLGEGQRWMIELLFG